MMKVPAQIAKHVREVYFGDNWTSVNLKETLTDVSWELATAQVQSLNSIATLVNHLHYYVHVVLKVLQGGPLQAKDNLSFEYPPIRSAEDWRKMLDKTWNEADEFANLIEKLPEEKLSMDFTETKYGNYYRNLQGIIEHIHYHLGQIVLIKKLLKAESIKN